MAKSKDAQDIPGPALFIVTQVRGLLDFIIFCIFSAPFSVMKWVLRNKAFVLSFIALAVSFYAIQLAITTEEKVDDTLVKVDETLGTVNDTLEKVETNLEYAQKQLNVTLYQVEYPKLNVTHEIDDDAGRLRILIRNDATQKETGEINFYRLEISDSKPHMQFSSLKPGESQSLDLAINVTMVDLGDMLEEDSPEGTQTFVLSDEQLTKLYFTTESSASISYKITCDNCYSQGSVKRIPEMNGVEPILVLHIDDEANLQSKLAMPVYSWVTYSLEDE